MDLDELADIADKVMEVATPTVAVVSDTHFDCTDNSEVKQLREEVARLTDLIVAVFSNPTVLPVQPLQTHPRTRSAGTTLNLKRQPRSARTLVAGETPRPDTSQTLLPPPF